MFHSIHIVFIHFKYYKDNVSDKNEVSKSITEPDDKKVHASKIIFNCYIFWASLSPL